MGHQEFERMILEREDLDRTDLGRLEAHLQECDQCTQLSARLDAVEGVLGSASFVSPPDGFATRFQARLVKARQRRNARVMLLATTLTAAAVVAGLVFAGYAVYSSGATFLSWLLKGLNQVYWLGTVFEVAIETFVLFLESLLQQTPFLLLLAVSAAVSSLVFTWITSFYRISYREIRRE